MSVFEPVALTWKGEEYKIESDKVMMLIAKIEDIITLSEVYNYAQKGPPPLLKLQWLTAQPFVMPAQRSGMTKYTKGCSVAAKTPFLQPSMPFFQ